jgi:hypothetical protein
VLFLDHDGDTRIVFPTLSAFLEAARRSVSEFRDLRSFHPGGGVLISNQDGLNSLIGALYDGSLEIDGVDAVLALLPSSDLSAVELLQRMSHDEDFYIVEAIGDAVARRPRSELESVAAICRDHSHPQASKAGQRAMAAIAALRRV